MPNRWDVPLLSVYPNPDENCDLQLFHFPVSEGQILENRNYHGLRARFLRASPRKLPNVLILEGLGNLAERGGFDSALILLGSQYWLD